MNLEREAKITTLTPEEAIQLLRRVVTSHSTKVPGMLEALEAACWRTLPIGHQSCSRGAGKTPDIENQGNIDEAPDHGPIKIRFSQLYRGTEATMDELNTSCQNLETKLQQIIERNNQLPSEIADREAAILKTINSLTSVAAEALDCDIRHPLTEVILDIGGGGSNTSVAAMVESRLQTLRQRKELRIRVCNDLRSAINDHMTHASELKKEITVFVSDVKKEEAQLKLKSKRFEELTSSEKASTFHNQTRTTASVALILQSARTTILTQDEQRVRLQQEINRRRTYLRTRTQDIFDVRNKIREVQARKAEVVAHIAELNDAITHIQRSCTPRPDWEELKKATIVTTAVDRSDKKSKVRKSQAHRKSSANTHDEEEDGDAEHRLDQILSSNWSTINKVNALVAELGHIRVRYHSGETITSEQLKLDHLQREITKTLQQLEMVKSKRVVRHENNASAK